MNQYATLFNFETNDYCSKLIAAILILAINFMPTAPVFAAFWSRHTDHPKPATYSPTIKRA